MSYQFAEFTLDRERFELLRRGEVVRLQPRAMRLLDLLVSAEGRLLTKQRIFDEVWDGRAVSDSALSSQIKALRKALGDTERPYRVIGTVHGQGFRLLANTSRPRPASVARATAEAPDTPADRIGSRPSIAVLPFTVLDTSDPRGALSEALPDEIITALSRLRMLHVIARGSSFQFPAGATSLSEVRRALSVQYCLSGTIEIAGDKLFVTAELADTRDDSIVWAERFAGSMGAIHEIRQDIVAAIVSEVELRISHNEAQRVRLKVPDQLTAWQAFHLGMSHIFMRDIRRQNAAARFFEQAIAIDPTFSRAHAGLSHTYWWLNIQHLFRDTGDMRMKMIDSAKRAIDCDPFDPAASLAMARSTSFEDTQDESLMWLDRTIEYCPNYAWGHSQIAAKRSMTGPVDVAVDHAMKALALSPRDPLRHSTYAALATAHIHLGKLEEAAEWGRKIMELPHTDIVAMVSGLCANYVAGHRDVSLRIARRIEEVHPGFTTERFVKAHPMMRKEAAEQLKGIFAAHDIP
ncbi:winged helix-turn-helix domain-containing protein [Parasphingopyxis sp.]|uniref:winged helix-turn-helix domain-containing tetratricopeptide repeat protein n=1 Tax=Parasphingopyxis sp. TaxID=1920299 RepID=UPI002611A1B4|nr:winged helix-turn-helix domain-containing protein [Parasphingopyxis sp.]